jgi:GWxTD domain-containing protein
MRRVTCLAIAGLGVAIGLPLMTSAQAPTGSEALTGTAVKESLAVLRRLDDALRRNRNDAASHYRRGMVAWTLWERSRHLPPIPGLDWRALGPMADSSLRIAALLEPDSTTYTLSVLRFLLGAGVQFRRAGPYKVFGAAVDNARASGDPAVYATVALDAGRAAWLDYEHLFYCENFEGRSNVRRAVGAYRVRWEFYSGVPDRGERGFLTAEFLFREAYEAAPDSLRAFRALAMLLADRLRWRELVSLARDQLNRGVNRDWAWMTMGLALFRLEERGASAAFDSAFVYLDSLDTRRMFRFDRVLPVSERAAFAAMTDSARSHFQEEYWRKADAMWSLPSSDPRTEFHARVTLAELRWTSPELGINGVNTDMGYFYVLTGIGFSESCKPRILADLALNDTTIFTPVSPEWPPREIEGRWNGPSGVRIYTMPVQVARFRAPRDSVDVMVAALPSYSTIQRSSDVAGPLTGYYWLYQDETRPLAHDSVHARQYAVHAFTRRVAPGIYGFRMEATADAALIANRATGSVRAEDDPETGFGLHGYGLSDVVIAARAISGDAVARRWIDLGITPIPGLIPRRMEMSLVWELYDAAEDRGHTRYEVTIAVRRAKAERTIAGRIVGAILGGVASAIRVDESTDQLMFTYTRDVAHSAVLVDNVAVTLGDTPPGSYELSVSVRDLISGRVATRTQPLRIAEPPAAVRRVPTPD